MRIRANLFPGRPCQINKLQQFSTTFATNCFWQTKQLTNKMEEFIAGHPGIEGWLFAEIANAAAHISCLTCDWYTSNPGLACCRGYLARQQFHCRAFPGSVRT